jgi:hypothetical protein
MAPDMRLFRESSSGPIRAPAISKRRASPSFVTDRKSVALNLRQSEFGQSLLEDLEAADMQALLDREKDPADTQSNASFAKPRLDCRLLAQAEDKYTDYDSLKKCSFVRFSASRCAKCEPDLTDSTIENGVERFLFRLLTTNNGAALWFGGRCHGIAATKMAATPGSVSGIIVNMSARLPSC